MSQSRHATSSGVEPPHNLFIWLLAARPKTLWASIAPVVMGSAMAYADGVIHWTAALVALGCAVLIQVSTNFANDLFDFEKGADTPERQGPLRVTQAGFVTTERMKRATLYVLLLTLMGGLYLTWRGGWPILLIGVASIAAGMLYTGGPYPLGYMGFGDLLVLVFFGPVAVGGAYYVQALSLPLPVAIAGLAPGLLSVAILTVNNLRDIEQDRKAGKKTLVVRFGRVFARGEYMAAVVVACFIPVLLYSASGKHFFSLLTLTTLIAAWPAFRRIRTEEGPSLNPLLGYTSKLLIFFSTLFAIGWVL